MTKDELIAFETEIAEAFGRGEIRGPTHLVGGNEDQLIEIFKDVGKDDWVFSTYRSHYHALLHGVPADKVRAEIMAGRSMNMFFPEHRFLTSAIVAGCLPIAVGVAYAMKRNGEDGEVWCFMGDMAATTGIYSECMRYVIDNALPVNFVIEDNKLSCNTPTSKAWGLEYKIPYIEHYRYERTYPHVGIDKWVQF
jgi:TPP-dependent pyruvate/acetoin dehydrogenase alpha subunit